MKAKEIENLSPKLLKASKLSLEQRETVLKYLGAKQFGIDNIVFENVYVVVKHETVKSFKSENILGTIDGLFRFYIPNVAVRVRHEIRKRKK